MSPSNQAVLSQPEVPSGHAPTSLSCPRGEAILPHRHEAAEDCVCSYQTLLQNTGKSFGIVQLSNISYVSMLKALSFSLLFLIQFN